MSKNHIQIVTFGSCYSYYANQWLQICTNILTHGGNRLISQGRGYSSSHTEREKRVIPGDETGETAGTTRWNKEVQSVPKFVPAQKPSKYWGVEGVSG